MREIKFRAWIKPTAHMISVDLLKFEKGNIVIEKHRAGEQPPFDIETRWTITDKLDADGQHDCYLMQFTGLKDKNGKEIYEGDILSDHKSSSTRTVVEFNDARFGFRFSETWFDLSRLPSDEKVIGNIYQNPDLLKS
jgi:uncharacterized phage protein (TIGR01671 family)